MLPVKSPADLLATPHRQKQISIIRGVTSLPAAQWQQCYQDLFERLAAWVQELPASEYHHHAYPGGLLDHCLEVAATAASLRRGFTLPTGGEPETIRRSSEIWTFAAVSAALLHDIGKIISDQHIEVYDGSGTAFSQWHPWHGPLHQLKIDKHWLRAARSSLRWPAYRMRFRPDRSYRHHEASALLLAKELTQAAGLNWMAEYPDAFNAWLNYLAGHKERSELTQIITQADKASTAKALGGSVSQAINTQGQGLQALHDKIIHGLRYLITEGKMALNRPGAPVWLTKTDVWLVSKASMDAVRAQLLSEGHTGVPSKNSVFFDTLQERELLIPCDDKAIWTATVNVGDWSQQLTLLRMRPTVIWPSGELPTHAAVTITPVGEPQEDANSQGDAASAVLENNANASTEHASAPNILSTPAPIIEQQPVEQPTDDPLVEFTNTSEQAEDGDPDDPFAFMLAAEEPQTLPTAPTPTPTPAQKSLPVAAPVKTSALTIESLLVDWLKTELADKRLRMNDPKARVHTLAGGIFLVSPGIFHEFLKKNPVAPELIRRDPSAGNKDHWIFVQKRFESLEWHQRSNGMNIRRAQVISAKKSGAILQGYFIQDRSRLLEGEYFDNPHLSLLD